MKSAYLLVSFALIAMSASARNYLSIPYPEAPCDNTVDEYFGTKLADPYRLLENDTAAYTEQWVNAENALTQAYLMQIPFRDSIRARLTHLNNYVKTGLPFKENDGMIYFYENDGLRNQSILYRKATLDSDAQLFLDPNSLSTDGTVALKAVQMSKSGKFTAYTISRSGSDWEEIYVIDTATGQPLADHVEWTKFSSPEWIGDEGFLYSAYDRPEAGKEFSNTNEYHRVYFHKLGTPQSEDTVVYENRDEPLCFHQTGVSEDGSAMIVYVSGQGVGNAMLVKALNEADAQWQVMEPTQDFEMSVVDVIDGKIYFTTTKGAPRGKLMMAPLKTASNTKTWRTVIPEQKGVLSSVSVASDKLVVKYESDASDHLYIYNLKGKKLSEIKLPTYGSVGVSASKKSPEFYYSFTSFAIPAAQYVCDVNTCESRLLRSTAVEGFNPDAYVTEQVFYPSSDGTMIPMFITYKKGLEKNGKNPVYLYGYGGFNISLTPSFSANRLIWLENGGIYAQANLRGGSEYGEEWHQAGTKMNKLNVFNDFISAAEYMIAQGWTTKELMTIEGGSNGGLLVGACVNMRPDLFKVAIPRVGVMDMMRYHLFTIGWNWAPDYGTSADSKEMADYLRSYSPAHNISNDGTPYPAILVTTADHDDRVVPAHSFKYAAALQAANTGNAPKLIRIDSKAGHGGGKPMTKVIDEYTDLYSFIFFNLGLTPDCK